MKSWELSELQRQVQAKRHDVETLGAAIANLETTLAEAADFEGQHTAKVLAIGARMARIQTIGGRMGGALGDPNGLPGTGRLTDALVAEYEGLTRQLEMAQQQHEQAIADRRVRIADAMGLDRSWSPLSVTDVSVRLDRVRLARNVAGAALADLEARLSAGEIVQTGVEAPDLSDHKARMAALRAKYGEPQTVA